MRDAVLSLAISQPSVRGILNPRQGTPASARQSPLNSYAERSVQFDGGPQPGDIVPNIAVRMGDRTVRLHERLDARRFTAILFKDQAVAEGLTKVVLGEDARERFAAEERTCYLVRPDHLVCARWKDLHARELGAALAHACGGPGVA
jgi:3-(3-hydroxy-phenyl)propionate hydroxylase